MQAVSDIANIELHYILLVKGFMEPVNQYKFDVLRTIQAWPP
jgi:hypothetical protein